MALEFEVVSGEYKERPPRPYKSRRRHERRWIERRIREHGLDGCVSWEWDIDTYGQSGIYKIDNDINNDFYIGRARCVVRRWITHLVNLRGNKHRCTRLQGFYNEHGIGHIRFSVVEFCSPDWLVERERLWIDKMHPTYNTTWEERDMTRKRNQWIVEKINERNARTISSHG